MARIRDGCIFGRWEHVGAGGRLDYVRTGGAPLLRGRRLAGLAGLAVICSGSREKLDS